MKGDIKPLPRALIEADDNPGNTRELVDLCKGASTETLRVNTRQISALRHMEGSEIFTAACNYANTYIDFRFGNETQQNLEGAHQRFSATVKKMLHADYTSINEAEKLIAAARNKIDEEIRERIYHGTDVDSLFDTFSGTQIPKAIRGPDREMVQNSQDRLLAAMVLRTRPDKMEEARRGLSALYTLTGVAEGSNTGAELVKAFETKAREHMGRSREA